MARTSKTVTTDVSLEDAQQAANIYAANSRKIEKLTARMNDELTRIRTKYEPDITSMKAELEEPAEILEAYAKEQKGTWGDKKSLELNNCVIGFRTSPPSLDKDKKFTWAAIIEFMKANKLLKAFVRTKEEVNKEGLLKESKGDPKLMKALEDAGHMEVIQKETFFIDTKAEG